MGGERREEEMGGGERVEGERGGEEGRLEEGRGVGKERRVVKVNDDVFSSRQRAV